VRTAKQLLEEGECDEMALASLAALDEVRGRLSAGLQFLASQTVPIATVQAYVLSLVDTYANEIYDTAGDDDEPPT
jgi:hypothetical protein